MGGLRDFFTAHRPTDLTVEVLETEIRRLEADADRIEYVNWNSDPHLEAAKLLREDATALKSVLTRVIAGQTPIPPRQKGEVYSKGSIVLEAGAVWQRTSEHDDWTVIAGTPTPKAAPVPAVIDTSLDLTEGMPNKTAEDRKELKFAQAVERRVKDAIEESELSESALQRPISLRYLLATKAVLTESLIEALASRDEKIRGLTKRIEELEAGGIKYCGVWQRAISYSKGSLVTEGGSAWIAVRASSEGEKPGSSEAWQLAVKSGRDGKDSSHA